MLQKVLRRSILSLVALAIVAPAIFWFALRASLPVLDGELGVMELANTASIERDADGVPTIVASSRQDLAFATGFVHAQDRYFQMDLIRRDAAGELAALVGPAAVDLDRRRRFHQFRQRARDVLAMQSEQDLALLNSYVAGVNAGLASLAARPPEYWLLGQRPEPWSAEDTLLVVYAMYLQLNDSRARKDVRRGFAHATLPDDVYRWLYPSHTHWDAPIESAPFERAPVPPATSINLREQQLSVMPEFERSSPPLPGSNNWVVSGALTETGGALVSNDMHLGHSVPNIWYRARLIVTGDASRDLSGVSLPGTPFIVAGSNGRIAWGYTNSYGDWSDAVIVKPGARPETYLTQDGEEAIDTITESIEIAGEAPVDYAIRMTRWGPIDDQMTFGAEQIAIAWLAHHPRATNLAIMDLETADNVAEALAIGSRMGLPPQNLVVGDADGNIGWTIAGQIPRRANYDPMLPADWSQGDGWQGWIQPDAYPRVLNPDSQRIWTANARVVDGEALRIIGDGGYDLGARATQIRDALFAAERFSPAEMLALQRDSRALFLGRWRDLLLDVLDDESVAPDLAEYRQLVQDWVPSATPESVGYRLVRAFRLQTRGRLFELLASPVRQAFDESANALMSDRFEAALWDMVTTKPQHLLPDGFASWEALLLEVLREVDAVYRERYPGSLDQRTWGELNTARIRHPFSAQLPFLSRWLDMPSIPLPGDEHLPLAQGQSFGASQRFSVIPGDEASGLMQMPAGQSGHFLSPFYRRGHQDWVEGREAPFLPGETRHTLTLNPAGP